jgi:transcriptional regulator with XRE-family HTH domain
MSLSEVSYVAETKVRDAFRARLSETRERVGFADIPALARAVGMSGTQVRKWEAGTVLPDGYSLVRLCIVLGVSPSYLLGADVWGPHLVDYAPEPADAYAARLAEAVATYCAKPERGVACTPSPWVPYPEMDRNSAAQLPGRTTLSKLSDVTYTWEEECVCRVPSSVASQREDLLELMDADPALTVGELRWLWGFVEPKDGDRRTEEWAQARLTRLRAIMETANRDHSGQALRANGKHRTTEDP